VSNPATRKDLAARTWGVFWYQSKIPVLFEIMVQIKQKGVQGSKARLQEASRSETCNKSSVLLDVCVSKGDRGDE